MTTSDDNNINCQDFPQEYRMAFKEHYYDAGIVGSVILGLVLIITLTRLVAHIKMKSRITRIGLHVILLLGVALDFIHFVFYAQYSNSSTVTFCFAYLHQNISWSLHMLGTTCHFLALLMTANTWYHLRKKTFVTPSWINGCKVLTAAFAVQFISTIVLVVSALNQRTPSAFLSFLRQNNICFLCLGVTITFSLGIVLSLLQNGYVLQKRLRQSQLEKQQVQKSITQVNIALTVIVCCTLTRAVVYIMWLCDRQIWNSASSYFWFYFLHTIAPVSVTTLAILYLSRRKQNSVEEQEFVLIDNSVYVSRPVTHMSSTISL